MLLLTLTIAAEAVLHTRAQLVPDGGICGLMRGDAADGIDMHLKRQICDDSSGLLYIRGGGGELQDEYA